MSSEGSTSQRRFVGMASKCKNLIWSVRDSVLWLRWYFAQITQQRPLSDFFLSLFTAAPAVPAQSTGRFVQASYSFSEERGEQDVLVGQKASGIKREGFCRITDSRSVFLLLRILEGMHERSKGVRT